MKSYFDFFVNYFGADSSIERYFFFGYPLIFFSKSFGNPSYHAFISVTRS